MGLVLSLFGIVVFPILVIILLGAIICFIYYCFQNKFKKAFVSILIPILLFGVIMLFTWMNDETITRHITTSEVVGRWLLTQDSIDTIRRYPVPNLPKSFDKETYYIDFHIDGSCKLNIIIDTLDHDLRNAKVVDFVGQWKIDENNKPLIVITDSTHQITFPLGEAKSLYIWQYFTNSDPDGPTIIQYQRMN